MEITIEEAVEQGKRLLKLMKSDEDPYYVGEETRRSYDALRRLVRYAQIMMPVPTNHDGHAEMERWERFFEERKEKANGECN